MDDKRKIPLGGQSILLEDVFFSMCRRARAEVEMRVPLLSKDGDFAGNVNIRITRPSTGGFNVTLLSAESLRDTAVLTSIQGQVDWPLFHIGGVVVVAYFVLGECPGVQIFEKKKTTVEWYEEKKRKKICRMVRGS